MAEQVATNITWHDGDVTPDMRKENMGQQGASLWLTGLSASGKSTVAMALEKLLLSRSMSEHPAVPGRTFGTRSLWCMPSEDFHLLEHVGFCQAPIDTVRIL